MLTRVYPDTIETTHPLAIAALSITPEEVEQTDYIFYVDNKGTLFCESMDEQMAFKYCAPHEWLLLDYFPLKK
jgi:hypothetical protein